ncbi:MAG: hypothetical protein C7B46_11715 [Sulfobacillus benefaciens]|uniref:Uncharacterized protein n=1 Tax=Sulfobacillus benefaciens TaxID=453960 RepID=A0A2T2XEX4_9FIRM|nr:MAG: hypothetical protein C7B46_11715 [Sulfobacillus benefaciens]
MNRHSYPKPIKFFIRFVKTPKGVVLTGLAVLTLVASLFPQGKIGLWHAVVADLTAVSIDALVALVLRRRVTFSTGGLITGLIVADVLSSLTPLYLVILTTVVALMSKHVIRRGRKPIFNPAAVGLVFALSLFSSGQSWWAALTLLPIWYLAFLLAIGVYVALRVKKYPQVLAFLGTYFALLLAMALLHLGLRSDTPGDALRVPFINAALFLGFFMLTDPPTSPAITRDQVLFGVIVGGIAVILFALFGGLAYLLIALLLGNLWSASLAWMRRAVFTRPVATSPGTQRPR